MCTTDKTEKLKLLEQINDVANLQFHYGNEFDRNEMVRAFSIGDYDLIISRIRRLEVDRREEADKLFKIMVFIGEYELAERLNHERLHGAKK